MKILKFYKQLKSEFQTNSNLLSTTIEIEGLDYGEAVVTAKCGKLKAFNNLNIEVVSKPEPKKEYFQFENKSYHTGRNGQ